MTRLQEAAAIDLLHYPHADRITMRPQGAQCDPMPLGLVAQLEVVMEKRALEVAVLEYFWDR
ncbi:MAG: hypothetical protein AB7G47_07265 [Mycolicibacterium sp.]|uniref:hypothetical protein n=1 Tax=Mycolicibacterium sp. TaxID=2320850 RepID=UPI003D0CC682